MRIISQDGRFDVPYEKLSFQICGTIIYVRGDCFDLSNCLFAEYGTTEKAKKAMEILHEEWEAYGYAGLFQFPKDEEIEEFF